MSTVYTPAMMNRVIDATWARLSYEARKTIRNSLRKMKEVLLQPPTTEEFTRTAAL